MKKFKKITLLYEGKTQFLLFDATYPTLRLIGKGNEAWQETLREVPEVDDFWAKNINKTSQCTWEGRNIHHLSAGGFGFKLPEIPKEYFGDLP